MSAAKDPLDGLADSLDAEEEAVGRRFREAERFTQGLPPAGASEETEAPSPAPVARSARSSGVVRTQVQLPGRGSPAHQNAPDTGSASGLEAHPKPDRSGRHPSPRRHDSSGVRRDRGAERALEAGAETELVKSFSDARCRRGQTNLFHSRGPSTSLWGPA